MKTTAKIVAFTVTYSSPNDWSTTGIAVAHFRTMRSAEEFAQSKMGSKITPEPMTREQIRRVTFTN